MVIRGCEHIKGPIRIRGCGSIRPDHPNPSDPPGPLPLIFFFRPCHQTITSPIEIYSLSVRAWQLLLDAHARSHECFLVLTHAARSRSHGTLSDEEIRARASATLNPQFTPHGSGQNRVGERNCIGSQRVTSGIMMVSQWLAQHRGNCKSVSAE